MRLSVNENDPGYRDDIFSLDVEVYLEEEKVDDVLTADEEEGYILKYVDSFETAKDHILTEELYGKVRITLNGRQQSERS